MLSKRLNLFCFLLLLAAGMLSAADIIQHRHSPSKISKHISILRIFSHKCTKHHTRFEPKNKNIRFERTTNRKKTSQVCWIKHVRKSRNLSTAAPAASTNQSDTVAPSQEIFVTFNPEENATEFQHIVASEIPPLPSTESKGFCRFSALAYS